MSLSTHNDRFRFISSSVVDHEIELRPELMTPTLVRIRTHLFMEIDGTPVVQVWVRHDYSGRDGTVYVPLHSRQHWSDHPFWEAVTRGSFLVFKEDVRWSA